MKVEGYLIAYDLRKTKKRANRDADREALAYHLERGLYTSLPKALTQVGELLDLDRQEGDHALPDDVQAVLLHHVGHDGLARDGKG